MHPLLILSDIPEPRAGWPPAMFPSIAAADGHRDSDWLCFNGKGQMADVSAFYSRGDRWPVGRRFQTETKHTASAFEAARSARFEHSEQP